MKIYQVFAALLFAQLISGCASTNKQSAALTVKVEPYDQPFSFEGKGSGAGMMLVGAMGPAGIAIGVAIDVGIGKDIYAAFEREGYTVPALVTRAFSDAHNDICESQRASGKASGALPLNFSIKINKLGFVLVSGGDDYVRSEFDLSVSADGQVHRIAAVTEPSSRVTLEELKASGVNSSTLLYHDMHIQMTGLLRRDGSAE